jgi:outer membrane protein OmpU
MGLDIAARADQGLAGTVFLQSPTLRLSMGDVQGAAAAAVGQVVTVGLTELGDPNNITYLANGGVLFDDLGGLVPADTADPSALVTWTKGTLRLHASLTNPSGATTAWALGMDRQSGDLRLALAVERQSAARQVIAGATLTRGDVTLKAVAGVIRSGAQTYAQGAVGAVWTRGDLTLQAFAADDSRLGLGTSARALGIGAEYELGGHARLKGGIAWDLTHDRQAFDIGVALGF